ncbi:MAG: tetratricopeptide repeat protein [Verrucomicrobia bacterium]|nr:tetratricopeptide repeat protein [Verrucomicrobiota bacterium]
MIERVLFGVIAAVLSLAVSSLPAAEKSPSDQLLEKAKTAYTNNKRQEAMALATQAIEVEPKNPRSYFVRARFHEESHEPAKAIADYDEAIKLDPRLADAYQHRGGEHFKLAHIKESLADFDKFIELVPSQAPYHWQRGIALYYAGRFEEGRKQFESHQTVNPNDVENAVWHFLCVARADGVEKARAALIPIKGDARVPMMEVHALFAGKTKPEDVLKAAGAGGPPTLRLNHQLFYAHLYLGLYFEALGDDKQAREHIAKAAGEFQTGDYMGDVARVHLQLRWPKDKSAANGSKSPLCEVTLKAWLQNGFRFSACQPTPNPSQEGSNFVARLKPFPLLGGVRGGFRQVEIHLCNHANHVMLPSQNIRAVFED